MVDCDLPPTQFPEGVAILQKKTVMRPWDATVLDSPSTFSGIAKSGVAKLFAHPLRYPSCWPLALISAAASLRILGSHQYAKRFALACPGCTSLQAVQAGVTAALAYHLLNQ